MTSPGTPAIAVNDRRAHVSPHAVRKTGRRDRTYLMLALGVSFVAFFGFSFSYFGPLLRGHNPTDAPVVHIHGWSFFLWYLLFPLQAGLIQSGNRKLHRALGTGSIGLATLMVQTGLAVITVNIHEGLQPGANRFWRVAGLPVFSMLLLFVAFYVAAMRLRRRPALHKRLMLLASVAALTPAVFRVVLRFSIGSPWAELMQAFIPIMFILAALLHERGHEGRFHPLSWVGLSMCLGIPFSMAALTGSSLGEMLLQSLGKMGSVLSFVY